MLIHLHLLLRCCHHLFLLVRLLLILHLLLRYRYAGEARRFKVPSSPRDAPAAGLPGLRPSQA